jgi:hypothetical protein
MFVPFRVIRLARNLRPFSSSRFRDGVPRGKRLGNSETRKWRRKPLDSLETDSEMAAAPSVFGETS